MQKIFCAKALISLGFFWPTNLLAGVPDPAQIDRVVESTAKSIGTVCYYGHCNQLSDVIVGIIGKNGPVIRAYHNGHLTPDVPKGKFGIASLSKAFTGLIVQILVDERKIDLDAPIANYLPRSTSKKDVPIPTFEGKKITVRELLNHTSALPTVIEPKHGIELPGDPAWDIRVRNQLTTEEIYEYFRSLKLPWAPGSKYMYSNLGYALLTIAIGNIEKAPYETVLKRRILEPLGMHATGTKFLDSEMMPVYGPTGSRISAAKMFYHQGFDTPHEGAGAIKTTIFDMVRYMAAELELPTYGQLPKNILEAMKKVRERSNEVFVKDGTKDEEGNYGIYPAVEPDSLNFLNLTDGHYYGSGWSHYPGSDRYSHSGSITGYKSRIVLDLGVDPVAVFVVSNSEFGEDHLSLGPDSMAKRIANLATYCVDIDKWENGKPPTGKCSP
jgi:CubicO group peptidase (beta-lactamase class C family)